MNIDVMADVVEMLNHGIADIYLAGCDAQRFHKSQRVGVSAAGGAETGHGDSDYAFAVEFQAVESAGGDKECERGIKAA